MQANELRIGNYVSAPLWRNEGIHIQKVYSLKTLWGEYYINHDFKETGYEFGAKIETEVEPIPLNEEWLLKFGFKKNIDYELINEYGKLSESNARRGVGLYFNDGEWFVTFREDVGCGWNDLNEINYVHQLQNLYFALTGDELTISNK